MSFFSKSKPPQQQPRPTPGLARATQAEDPAGDGPSAAEKRKKRRRGLRTVLTQGEQTNLGATAGKSLLG